MFITSWTIDIRINIQIWLLYRRYKSEWYNFWWATLQDIAACACKVWTLFDQACGQEECSQTTTTMTTTTTTTMTDKSGLHRLTTDILSWAKKLSLQAKQRVGALEADPEAQGTTTQHQATMPSVGPTSLPAVGAAPSALCHAMVELSMAEQEAQGILPNGWGLEKMGKKHQASARRVDHLQRSQLQTMERTAQIRRMFNSVSKGITSSTLLEMAVVGVMVEMTVMIRMTSLHEE